MIYKSYYINTYVVLLKCIYFRMAEDLDVEAMLEAPYNKSVSE